MRKWFAAAMLPIAVGCAATQKEPPPRPFVGTRWEVILELPMAGEQPSFRFGDGRMEGYGGCNRISARYVQDTVGARAIVIGRIETGMRSCDKGAQAAERQMLEVLQSVSSYSITADTMTMTGSGGTLKFRALPVDGRP
ncbi:MAG: META domain-containing protein [Usitatibacter sp.]